MAAGDTLRRISPNDQLIVDINGNVVGVKSPNANGADLRFDPSSVAITGGTIAGVRITGVNSLTLPATIWKGKPVANNNFWHETVWNNVPAFNSRKRYIANRATAFVRLVYSNIGLLDDASSTTPLTVRAGVEPSSGATRIRVLFNGQPEAEIGAGGIVVSDPVPCSVLANGQFYVWTYSSGPNQIFMGPCVSAWGEGGDAVFNTAPADKTLSGSVGPNASSFYAPIAVIGDSGPTLPFVAHFGDSIAAGTGDAATPPDTGRGFLRQAMANTIPYVNLCIAGDTYAKNHSGRYAVIPGCTDVVDEMGVNEATTSGTSLATLQARMIAAWQVFTASGARVWKTTITPSTTSTDSWATLVNQTVNAFDSVRTGVNDWIRAGAPVNSSLVAVPVGTAGALLAGTTGHPLSGYFETADAVESSRNSGKWAVGITADGLHPTAAGHVLMAATINTARFTA